MRSRGTTKSGAAYLFDANSGNLTHTFLDPVSGETDWFGNTVAGVGTNWVVVGAPKTADGTGAAYVYDATTGALTQTLPLANPSITDSFGGAIAAFDSTHVLVSAVGDNTFAHGTVHMYDVTTGADVKDFVNPDSNPFHTDSFGSAVTTIDSNRILVGAALTPVNNLPAGVAYVMDAHTGASLLTIPNPFPQQDAFFGASMVSIGNNLIAIGAPSADTFAPDGGAVYVFNATTGALVSSLHMPVPQNEAVFGSTLAVTSDGILLVGAQLADTSPNGAGAVYAFNPQTGQLLDTLLDPNAIDSGRFGASVATLPDNAILVGHRKGMLGRALHTSFHTSQNPPVSICWPWRPVF